MKWAKIWRKLWNSPWASTRKEKSTRTIQYPVTSRWAKIAREDGRQGSGPVRLMEITDAPSANAL